MERRSIPATPGRREIESRQGAADGSAGFSGVALARDPRSEGEVDALFVETAVAGAGSAKTQQKAFRGSRSGDVADSRGQFRELAHSPIFPPEPAGNATPSG